jgi:hypothetical protein
MAVSGERELWSKDDEVCVAGALSHGVRKCGVGY